MSSTQVRDRSTTDKKCGYCTCEMRFHYGGKCRKCGLSCDGGKNISYIG